MNIDTLITQYLAWYDDRVDDYGRSFISKSESGYYFPCHYVFYEEQSDPSFRSYLNFVKGTDYTDGSVGYTLTRMQTEDPTFDVDIMKNDYEYATIPFQKWQHIPWE